MANPLTNRKFIHFNKLESFENQLQNNPGSILDTQIVFIKDARKIWTHGTYYTLDERITNNIYSKLEALAGISADIIQKLDEAQFISAGPTADRPTGGELQQGICYLDTDLNEPIWWGGTNWIDAAGNNADLPHSGTTAQRPNIANVKIGFDYLDTTTGEFFISDGTQWVQFNKPATQTTPGIVQPRHTGTTNKSGLLITDNQGSLQINTRSELGLYIDGIGLLHANIEDAATDAEIEVGTSTTKALTPSNMDKIKSEVEGDLLPKDPAMGYDYIEIGGVKWATMNVGAESETDYGLYFQWGDTQGYTADQVGSGEGQKYFGWTDYKYGNGGNTDADMTKYNATDGKTVLEASDDAARVNWGGGWRIPTEAEFQALINATNITWTSITVDNVTVSGRMFTDKVDSSKKLFFPAAGYGNSDRVRSVNSYGFYWSSSHSASYVTSGRYLTFDNGLRCMVNDGSRRFGCSVRGVLDDSITPPPSKLHKVAITGDYNDLENKPTPTTTEEVAAGTATDKALTPANLNDILTVLLGKNFSDSNYTIRELFQYVLNQIEPVREFIDLGLPSGKLWATENVTGGDYTYEKDGYLYYKYQNDSDEPISQSAVAQWAHNDSTVSLPTKDDFEELIANTDAGLITINGVVHAKFTSKSDSTKFITFPMIGSYARSTFDTDSNGYWSSSTPSEQSADREYYLNLSVVDGSLTANTDWTLSRVNYLPLRAIKTPEPIPVEGDVQIFADPECTQYATGEVDTVYVRINNPWTGLNSGWSVGLMSYPNECFLANAPSTDYPDDAYGFICWVDFEAQTDGPYTAGQVVEAKASSDYNVTGYQTVFSRPS